ncbi:MarR family winged helix-turn-helix transcriptional regulator [Desulfosarcina ovata]|uniref:MarR family transcriptional regulator n=2 Tax=Desulfosarcina ovata TaxID=83564 RepID=A0A5K8AGX1_9BACT|nr:MarR family winged helix-turn-helix transcriptional regulator [Desulfosarcina ovata]BBO84965.1 MarR family transcriptional regulator [Desulfosarcina ovata subsp. sediminis]BBO91726.1 MarR family transcriptional regulator [Desulfosarcina ovata subsp. ovata]
MQLKGRRTPARFITLLFRMFTVYLNQEMPKLKIGTGQYIFLAELFDEDGRSQDDLTRSTYLNKANTARALKKLEDLGYVRRASDSNDHRVKHAYLEPAAREIEEEFWKIILKWSEILSRDLSKKRQQQLLTDLEKMADNAFAYLKRY